MIKDLERNKDRQIQIYSRPIRFAYILGANPDKKEIIKIISHCCESFGGFHNIIIPTDGSNINKYWFPFISFVDPDVIFLSGHFSDTNNIKEQLSKIDIQPFSITNFSKSLNILNLYTPLPIDNVYRLLVSESLSEDNNKFDLIYSPRRAKNINLVDYFVYGTLTEKFISKFKSQINFINVKKHLRHDIEEDIFSASSIHTRNISYDIYDYFKSSEEGSLCTFAAITGDPNSIDDCCLYWNFRALSCRNHFVRWIDKANITKLFNGSYCNKAIMESDPDTKLLTSISLGPSNCPSAKELLSMVPNYEDITTKLGFIYKHPTEYDKTIYGAEYFCNSHSASLSTGESLLINRLIPPPYDYQDCIFNSIILDCYVKSKDPLDKYGLILCPRQSIADALTLDDQSLKGYMRISKYSFTFILPSSISTEHIRIGIKTDWEIISNIFKSSGINITQSASSKHISKSIYLSTGVEELANNYRNKIARIMLDSFMIRHNRNIHISVKNRELYRRSFSILELRDEILTHLSHMSRYKKAACINEFNNFIELWWKKGVLISGFELKCVECNFETWYSIDLVGETYTCHRCQTVNKIPANSQIRYRLQESFYQAHFEHMIVPILTLDYIKSNTQESFLYSLPIYLDPNNPNSPELDLVLICDGNLCLAECKFPNKIDNGVLKLYSDTAKKIKAHRIIFSSLDRENTCATSYCQDCQQQNNNYSDEIFSHGVPEDSTQWGTRERIKDLRNQLSPFNIEVNTICAYDLGYFS
jgi:hypothetical protein